METRPLHGEGAEERRSHLRALLLDRRSERLDRVLSQLEAAARKAPGEAEPLVDLAAAQLTAGWARDSAGRFVDALESADRALEIEPASSRACFNRAFALEELGLRDLAREGWEDCERLEPDSEWRDEARRRAEALRVRPAPNREQMAAALDAAIRRNKLDELARWAQERPHQAAYLVICDLLPRWVETGLLDGAAWWPGLERLAEQVRTSTGDRLLSDAVREIRTALVARRGEEVAEGIRRLRSGLDSYREREYRETVVRLQASEANLRRVPALERIARIYGAVSLHASNQIEAAQEEVSRVLLEAGEQGHSWPLGYAYWTLGRMAMGESRQITALDLYSRAMQVFQGSRAQDLVPAVRMMMAEAYSDLGRSEQAWDAARRALHEAYRPGASDRLFFVLNLLPGIADEQGRPSLAVYAQTSAIDHETGEPARLRANAHLWRAYYLLNREDRRGQAQQDLRQAEALAREVKDPSESAKLGAEINLARGVLGAQTDPEAAVAWLGDAARLFEQAGGRFNRLLALKVRAQTLRKMGRAPEAAEELGKAIAAYDAAVLRDPAKAEPDRLSYLLQNAGVYQTMIDLHVGERDSPWKALVIAEHARSLRAPGRALSLPENAVERWMQALPAGTALLSYGTAEERIVAWVLTPDTRDFFQLESAGEVAALVDRLDRAQDAATWEDLSRRLYASLVGPLEKPLRGAQRILIVPTPGLDRVPFAGLLDPRSGSYLVETYLLEMLPSASALLRQENRFKVQGHLRRSLVVGDPQPTKAALLGLGRLRYAEQEAQTAASFLGPDTVKLLGADATPARFREEAVGARVIHVAGHALSLGRGTDSAALVLATSAGDEEGLLNARDVLRLPLSGTRLVILSVCSSAGGPAISWQSGLTLGRSFLSAGAERVIATLRAVDDKESALLFEEFHDALARGMDAAASLRSAQRKILQGRPGAESWTRPSWPYVIILGSRPPN